MKGSRLVLTALLLGAALAWPALAQPGAVGGLIETDQGRVIAVIAFTELVETLPVTYEESEEQAPLADIKSITRLDGDEVLLENIAGRKFKAIMPMSAISRGDMIAYRAVEPISGRVEPAAIDGAFVRRVSFTR